MKFIEKAALRFGFGLLVLSYVEGTYANSSFENRYTPTQREVCEMDATSFTAEYPKICKSVKILEPLIKSKTVAEGQKVSLSKEKFPNWPFGDVYFQYTKNAKEKFDPIFNIEGTSHQLRLEFNEEIRSVAIGYIDDAIILEIVEGLGGVHIWHKHIIFTPYSCEGYEGYGDEIYYGSSSEFGWNPLFSNQIFIKTFFSPIPCN